MSPAAEIQRLAELYREMLSLGQAGLNLLAREDLEAWDDLWARRRQLQRQAQAVCVRLKPVLAGWEAGLATLARRDPAQAQRLAGLMAEIKGIGAQVVEMDRQAQAAVAALLESTREQIISLEQGTRLRRAYRQAFRPGSLPVQLSRTG